MPCRSTWRNTVGKYIVPIAPTHAPHPANLRGFRHSPTRLTSKPNALHSVMYRINSHRTGPSKTMHKNPHNDSAKPICPHRFGSIGIFGFGGLLESIVLASNDGLTGAETSAASFRVLCRPSFAFSYSTVRSFACLPSLARCERPRFLFLFTRRRFALDR